LSKALYLREGEKAGEGWADREGRRREGEGEGKAKEGRREKAESSVASGSRWLAGKGLDFRDGHALLPLSM